MLSQAPDGTRKFASWDVERSYLTGYLASEFWLSNGAYRLWVEIAWNWCDKEHHCTVSIEELSKKLGRHRNTISRCLNELVDTGLVQRYRSDRYFQLVIARYGRA